MKKIFKTGAYSVSIATLFTLLFECARYGKINFIIGSSSAFFSLNHCITPLVGASSNFLGAAAIIFCLRMMMNNTAHTLPALLAYHIPSFFGAIAFSTINNDRNTALFKRLLLGAILLLCTALFIIHPIGYSAALYTALWLIPAVLLCIPTKNPFVHALISTFVTHAVGSVIWLYMFTTQSPEMWIYIMPIALIERIIFASGATICYYSMRVLYSLVSPCVTRVYKKTTIETHSL